MLCRLTAGAVTLAAVIASIAHAQIVDFSKYPNLKGQWTRFVVRGLGGQASFDQTKPWGFGQEAPLTPEYNGQVFIGKTNYYLSADGFLMPARKDQAPPDLRYFQKSQTLKK